MVKNLNASKMQSSRFCVLFIGSHMFSFRPRNFLFLISRSARAARGFAACRELEQRCRSICHALRQRFPERSARRKIRR